MAALLAMLLPTHGRGAAPQPARLARARLNGPQLLARPGHIHFDQSMDGMLPRRKAPTIDDNLPLACKVRQACTQFNKTLYYASRMLTIDPDQPVCWLSKGRLLYKV
jgi:hypothetical protein